MTDKSNEPTPAKVQPDDVRVGLMFGLLGALVIVVIVALVVLWQFFGKTADKVVAKQNLAKPSRVLKRVLRKQARQLATMGVLDETKGKYRIPIDQAMKILIDNQHLVAPAPKPPAKAKPAAAPQPGAPAPARGPSAPARAPGATPPSTAPGAGAARAPRAEPAPTPKAAPAATKRGN